MAPAPSRAGAVFLSSCTVPQGHSSGPWSFGPNLLRAEVHNTGGPTGYIARGVLNV
jgi:hypothetical protein